VFGSVVGPYAVRREPVLPATAGLAIQVAALAIYAQLTKTTGLWVVVLASIINGIGASFFFPANSSAVMQATPPEAFGIASGMLRTFANIGMVFSNASHG
jgi:MFS family permease